MGLVLVLMIGPIVGIAAEGASASDPKPDLDCTKFRCNETLHGHMVRRITMLLSFW